MARLYTHKLTVGYENNTIINNLNIEIPDEKITTIIGANGCGKSTLLKSITRILPSKYGSVILDGKNICKEKTKDLAKKIAILPQSPQGYDGLTVAELVSYGRFPYQTVLSRLSKRDFEVIDWALEVTGTKEYKYRTLDDLSGGQRQRVWIAMALVQETDIIFLDEPTTYLDISHQLEVLELLKKLNIEEKRTIVMVLHDINQASRFSDYIIALKSGKVVKAGCSEEVITKEVLKKVFQIDAVIGLDPITNKPICVTYNLLKGEKENEKNNCFINDDSCSNF